MACSCLTQKTIRIIYPPAFVGCSKVMFDVPGEPALHYPDDVYPMVLGDGGWSKTSSMATDGALVDDVAPLPDGGFVHIELDWGAGTHSDSTGQHVVLIRCFGPNARSDYDRAYLEVYPSARALLNDAGT